MKRISSLMATVFLVAAFAPAQAHEVRPGYLELRQTGDETFDATWKVPGRGDLRLAIYPIFPDECESLVPPSTHRAQGAWVDRWTMTCAGGLVGRTIGVEGLSGTLTDALFRFERAVEADPQNPSALNNLAVALEQMGQFQEAREHYERALELKPDDLYIQQNYDLFREADDKRNRKKRRRRR